MQTIKFTLRASGLYWSTFISDDNIGQLASFLGTEVGCPAWNWTDWIIDDSLGEETSGNLMFLKKKKQFIYIKCLYSNVKYFIIRRDQLVQLLNDWSEKVCKTKPQQVTITYDNDIFTIETE
jgi:hypothetical protein